MIIVCLQIQLLFFKIPKLKLVLCFSLTITALATETPASPDDDYQVLTVREVDPIMEEPIGDEFGVSPMAEPIGGRYEVILGEDDRRSFEVTPNRGWNLKVTMAVGIGPVGVSVKKSGAFGNIKSFSAPQQGPTTYDLVNNCDGGTYIVTFRGIGSHFAFQCVQTQYI